MRCRWRRRSLRASPTTATATTVLSGARKPSSRRLNRESAGRTLKTTTTSSASMATCAPTAASMAAAGRFCCGTPVTCWATNSATNNSASVPARTHVQKLLKLLRGQRVGQAGEIVEIESFTTELRREVTYRERPFNSRSVETEREHQTIRERFAPVRECAADDLPKQREVAHGDRRFGAPHQPNDARLDFRRRKERSRRERKRLSRRCIAYWTATERLPYAGVAGAAAKRSATSFCTITVSESGPSAHLDQAQYERRGDVIREVRSDDPRSFRGPRRRNRRSMRRRPTIVAAPISARERNSATRAGSISSAVTSAPLRAAPASARRFRHRFRVRVRRAERPRG